MGKVKLILSLLNRREKRQLVLVFLLMLVMGFIELAGVGSFSPFIAVAANPPVIHSNEYLSRAYDFFHFSSDTGFIIAFGIAVVLIITGSNLYLCLVSYVINVYSAKRYHSISMRLLERYLRQPYIFYLRVNTADLSKRLLNDTHAFVNKILIVMLQFVSNAVVSLFIVLLLIAVNPGVALIVSAVLACSYLLIFSATKNYLARKGQERNTHILLIFKYINETFGGIKDIKILGKESVFLNFFSGPSKKRAMSEAMTEVVNEIPKRMLETIAFGGILAVIIYLISSGSKIEEFLPLLTVYVFGAYRLLPALRNVFRAVADIKYNLPVAEGLHNDFTLLPSGEPLADGTAEKLAFRRRLTLDRIRFTYPGADRETINGVSLDIEANTSAALVGATGCGKTTLVDIILGLLEAREGRILVDDTEISAANRRAWQSNLGYVPQSIYLTDDTIRNNIAFGIAPEEIDDEKVLRAARMANIHDFIENELEKGYDTFVGDRGIRLSGGQRQRIGIARAVYHDPSVLILDEATSALDSLTENAVIDAINNLSHKKTIIMIAHRLSTVKYCDTVFLMDRGTITDRGSYDELYKRSSVFKKMADGH